MSFGAAQKLRVSENGAGTKKGGGVSLFQESLYSLDPSSEYKRYFLGLLAELTNRYVLRM